MGQGHWVTVSCLKSMPRTLAVHGLTLSYHCCREMHFIACITFAVHGLTLGYH